MTRRASKREGGRTVRREGSIRRAVRWAGAIATITLVAAIPISGWVDAGVRRVTPGTYVGAAISRGNVFLGRFSDSSVPPGKPRLSWVFRTNPWGLDWSPRWSFGKSEWGCFVPLWMLAVPIAIPTGLLWRRAIAAARAARVGHCPACGYDLAGITTAICPECGEPVPQPPPPPPATPS